MRQEIVRTSVLAVVAAALTGGLAGSIFTAYVNRQHQTVVTYKGVLWNLVDDKTTGLVPDLKIGNDNVQFIYTRSFDFIVRSGPEVDSASLVITFQPNLRIFGIGWTPPSSVRPEDMKCSQVPSAVRCDLRHLAPGDLSHYRLWIVTNQQHVGKIYSLNSVVELLPLDKYVNRKILIFCLVSVCVFFVSLYPIGRFRSWLEIQRLNRSLDREAFRPSDRGSLFHSDADRDALEQAFREDK